MAVRCTGRQISCYSNYFALRQEKGIGENCNKPSWESASVQNVICRQAQWLALTAVVCSKNHNAVRSIHLFEYLYIIQAMYEGMYKYNGGPFISWKSRLVSRIQVDQSRLQTCPLEHRWPCHGHSFTAEARIQSQTSNCRICDGRSCTGQVFLWELPLYSILISPGITGAIVRTIDSVTK